MHSCLQRSERHLVLMMNVGDDRHWRARNNLSKPFGGFRIVARATDDVATSTSQRINLLQRAFNVGSFRNGHRLNADRRETAHRNLANMNLFGYAALECHVSSVPLAKGLSDI